MCLGILIQFFRDVPREAKCFLGSKIYASYIPWVVNQGNVDELVQGLLTHMIGRNQLPWRIMAFPDLAEARPSGFKKYT